MNGVSQNTQGLTPKKRYLDTVNVKEIIEDIRPNEKIERQKILSILKAAYFRKIAKLGKYGEYVIEVMCMKGLTKKAVESASQNPPSIRLVFRKVQTKSRHFLECHHNKKGLFEQRIGTLVNKVFSKQLFELFDLL